MTVTALPAIAEDPPVPRRLLLQAHFATAGIDLDNPANVDHRTWLELVAAYAARDALGGFEHEMTGAIDQALRDGLLTEGGFLADEESRDSAIRASLHAACGAVVAEGDEG